MLWHSLLKGHKLPKSHQICELMSEQASLVIEKRLFVDNFSLYLFIVLMLIPAMICFYTLEN